MTDFDPWDQLDTARRAIYEKGEAAAQVLRKYETIERWHEIGDAAAALMADAMTYGHTNVPKGKGYNAAWGQLSKHVPTVRDIDKAARSAAVWMSQNWDAIDAWLRDPQNISPQERLKMNHPTVVRRRYEAAHRPEPDTASPPARESNAQTIIRLLEENDLLRKKGGGGLMPSASAAEVADAIMEAHNAAFARRLIAALTQRLEAEERQEGIEAKAQAGAAKRKSARKSAASTEDATPPA